MSKPDGIHWEWAEHCRKHTQKGSFILTACCRNEQEQRAARQARAAADEQTPSLPYLCADADGQLPSCAPLANPYVPFQQGGSKQYQTPKALVRGTIFPGLDLPFMGKVNETEKNGTALVQIQELGFALRELGLYLDTHQSDTEATALFNQYAERYEEAMQQYQQSGAALTQLESAQSGTYTWLNDPWPWEYRKEG